MEQATKNFARRVLLIHLAFLVIVIVVVVLASVEVYRRSREQAIEQAKQRQAMLASQMSSGIEGYYKSIFADLHLIKRAEEDETLSPRMRIGPAARAQGATASTEPSLAPGAG